MALERVKSLKISFVHTAWGSERRSGTIGRVVLLFEVLNGWYENMSMLKQCEP
jgi:hypothetical protein